jgi:dTDP-glucose 4,6-dehydratase
VRELSREARRAGLDVKVVPSVRELLGGEVRVGDLREPTEADLLGRHKVETDLQSVSDYIRAAPSW